MAETTKKETKTDKTATSKVVYYLSPNGDNGWKIMKKGGLKPSKVTTTKKEAIEYIKTLGRNQEAVVYIQSKTGQIQEVRNYRSN
ncbi:DUF2188 domain-containing protein [Ureaplasma canigenitalium]|uniref:DUF2188 domain-containing protein n=1 Tax=Ureaplasma canigenitalium TaxID=42092 RepID=UPI0006901205|nr:DUF2188 domain-containing protein [Ureaplasma canigenitalium]